MAKQGFVLQGFTTTTHCEAIARLFDLPDIRRAIISVAFVNRGGTELLEAQLHKYGAKTKAYIGIRNDITSVQGAKHLLELGVSLHTVDTGSRSVLFHPKLYLVEGRSHARLVVGSANLTIGGLNNNVEASIAIDLDLTDAADKALVDTIERQFDALVKEYPEHVVAVTKMAQLDALRTSGRLADETTRLPPRPASASVSPAGDMLSRIKLTVVALRRRVAVARKAAVNSPGAVAATKAKSAKHAAAAAAATPVPASRALGVEYEPVWQSKPLTRRDLNVPDGATTHRTGSINLDKGLLADEADHRHYFRDEVFDDLVWSPGRRPKVEEAYAKFQLVVKGISYGEFDLRIGHSTDTASKSYRQRNAMTRLSWGPMREYVARADLIGRTLALYRDQADPKRFILEID